MSKWKECCEKWYRTAKPHVKTIGRVSEVHVCPVCNEKLGIYFECSVVNGSMADRGYGEHQEDIVCKIVGVFEPVDNSRGVR